EAKMIRQIVGEGSNFRWAMFAQGQPQKTDHDQNAAALAPTSGRPLQETVTVDKCQKLKNHLCQQFSAQSGVWTMAAYSGSCRASPGEVVPLQCGPVTRTIQKW